MPNIWEQHLETSDQTQTEAETLKLKLGNCKKTPSPPHTVSLIRFAQEIFEHIKIVKSS